MFSSKVYNISMIEIKGTDIYRSGIKIGWVSGQHVYDNTGRIRGYFSNDTVYDEQTRILARVEGDYAYAGGRKIELEQILRNVEGVGVSDIGKVAISTFLGD